MRTHIRIHWLPLAAGLVVLGLSGCSAAVGQTGQPGDSGMTLPGANPHSEGPRDGHMHDGIPMPDAGAPVITENDPYAMPSDLWSNPATWGGTLPGTSTDVVIPAGRTITLDTNACVQSITVKGSLLFAPKDLELCSRSIMIENGGRLVVGTKERRFTSKAVITLIDGDRKEDLHKGMGTKVLGVMAGGRLDLHGADGFKPWTTLAGPTAVGATTLSLVDASGWKVGDSIVVSTGSYEPDEAEERTLTAVSGNQVTLDSPLKFARPMDNVTIEGRTLDMRAAVGRLSRNIVVQGDMGSANGAFGGHTMVMNGAIALVDGVAFLRMGQFDHLARYPFHWHLAGNVKGQYIRNSVVSHSFQRGIVVHTTQGALIENNIVFDSMGHSILVETGETYGNTFDTNLTVQNRLAAHTEPTLFSQNDREASGFWIKSARNTFTNNVSGGSSGSGFWYDGTDDGPTVFKGNTAYASAFRGRPDFVRESGLLVQNSANLTLQFDDMLLYHNHGAIWPQGAGNQVYNRFAIVDNGNPFTVETTQNGIARFTSPLIVGTLPPQAPGGAGLLVQYGGTVDLQDPVIVNFGKSGLLASNDVQFPWKADYRIRNARLVNSTGKVVPDISIGEYADDSFLPRGFYVPSAWPMLITQDMQKVLLGDPTGEQTAVYKSTQRLVYGVLTTWMAGAGGFQRGSGRSFFDPGASTIRRSDGYEYKFGGSFFFGYPLVCNSALTYQMSAQPNDKTIAVLIDPQNNVYQTTEKMVAKVAIPESAAPKRMLKMKNSEYDDYDSNGGTPMTAASSMAEFEASPSNRYFYDSGTRLLHIQAEVAATVIEF